MLSPPWSQDKATALATLQRFSSLSHLECLVDKPFKVIVPRGPGAAQIAAVEEDKYEYPEYPGESEGPEAEHPVAHVSCCRPPAGKG